MATSDSKDEIISLNGEFELRFIVSDRGQEVFLRVLEGSAEIYGSPLLQNDEYQFVYFSSVAVFSPNGCVLKLSCSERLNYKVRRSEDVSIVRGYHDYLESLRKSAVAPREKCPITLITGPTDVGKSTLCRYLLNYSARNGRRPIFIDLDVGQSSMSIPGTFGILPIQEPCDANGRFDERLLSAYFFGYKSPGHNMTLYKCLIDKLSQALSNRLMQKSRNSRCSGVIIDTCGWIEGGGYQLILQIIHSFAVPSVLVIGSRSHYEKLKYDVTNSVHVHYICKLDGVSFRNKTVRCNARDFCLHKYFYGSQRPLKPHKFQIHFSDVQILKANIDATKKSENCNNANEQCTAPVEIDPSLLYQVFGLSYAEHIDDALLSSVYGFICFIDIDMNSEVVTVLSPQPAPLPTKILIMGDLTYKPKDFEEVNI